MDVTTQQHQLYVCGKKRQMTCQADGSSSSCRSACRLWVGLAIWITFPHQRLLQALPMLLLRLQEHKQHEQCLQGCQTEADTADGND